MQKNSILKLVDEDIMVESLRHPVFDEAGMNVLIARLDKVDEVISGNKWFKLKHSLLDAVDKDAKGFVSFGGPYSNHLHALAAAGKRLSMPTVGILRGELQQTLTPTLADCLDWGMKITPVSREEYKRRNDPTYIAEVMAQFDGFYLIPEGGSNHLAVVGVSELITRLLGCSGLPDILVCPVGSGGTLAGCIHGVGVHVAEAGTPDSAVSVVGFSALKGAAEDLVRRVGELTSRTNTVPWMICEEYHFGGFGKQPKELVDFMASFYSATQVELDPVYTGKMLFGLVDKVQRREWSRGTRILVLHTGGLQGRRGM